MPISNAAAQYMQRVDDTLAGDDVSDKRHLLDAYVKLLAGSGLSKVFIGKRNHLFAFCPFQKILKSLFAVVLAETSIQQVIE